MGRNALKARNASAGFRSKCFMLITQQERFGGSRIFSIKNSRFNRFRRELFFVCQTIFNHLKVDRILSANSFNVLALVLVPKINLNFDRFFIWKSNYSLIIIKRKYHYRCEARLINQTLK